MSITTTNPATGKPIQSYDEMSSAQVDKIIRDTHVAFTHWRYTDLDTRKIHLVKMAQLLKKQQREFAEIITQEMGKPITQAVAEVNKCVMLCEYYASNADSFLTPRVIETDYHKSYVTYEPQGIVFAIMPWNFPLWQVMRFLVPCLLAGNAGLLSHAPISTGISLMIENLVVEAGYPKNLFRALIVDNDVAAEVIQHTQITGVTLTGSERAGMAVASEAGKSLKKSVMELGGSDPYIICEDADLEKAAEACVTSRLNNAGQVCIAAKRIIMVGKVKHKFPDLILEKMKAYKMGDPMDPKCNFGPLSRRDIRDEVHKQVTECIQKGADVLMGGEIPDREGFYYPPTLLMNLNENMPAYREEIFGPVVLLFEADSLEDAITLANDTRFGLGAAIFTADVKKGEEIAAKRLHAGTCCVNAFVASHPALPFGGSKASGYGRELSVDGMHEFVNIKTVCVNK